MSGHIRFAEKRYLWACHLYYKEGNSPVSDEDHDATERQLELSRKEWSDYFKAFLPDSRASLKTQAHGIVLNDYEIARAHKWIEWLAFLKEACE